MNWQQGLASIFEMLNLSSWHPENKVLPLLAGQAVGNPGNDMHNFYSARLKNVEMKAPYAGIGSYAPMKYDDEIWHFNIHK